MGWVGVWKVRNLYLSDSLCLPVSRRRLWATASIIFVGRLHRAVGVDVLDMVAQMKQAVVAIGRCCWPVISVLLFVVTAPIRKYYYGKHKTHKPRQLQTVWPHSLLEACWFIVDVGDWSRPRR